MSNFHAKWKQFLKEDQDPAMLLEARVKDVKAKYKVLDESGWINWARRQIENTLGPKGVSKYLMYWAREVNIAFEGDNAEEIKNSADVLQIGEEIMDLITKFQQNQQRMEEKDIYKYNAAQLQQAIEKLAPSGKEKKAKEKEEAIEGSEIVYDNNDILGVRPFDENASCYYGKNTRWCISATQARNYFNQYTQDGKGFIMLRLDNIPPDDENHKIALVFDQEGDFEEAYDATDDQLAYVEVRRAIALNHSRPGQNPYDDLDEEEQEEIDSVLSGIMDAGYQSMMDSPPDPTEAFTEKAEELERQYHSQMQNAYSSYDVDAEYFYFNGGMTIEIPNEKFEDGKYPLPSEWRALHNLSEEVREALDNNASIYAEEVDISDYSGVTSFRLDMSTEGYEPNPDGYESFLDELLEWDSKYDAAKSVIERFLQNEGYIAQGAFLDLADKMEDVGSQLKNFTWDQDLDYGDELIEFKSDTFRLTGIKSSAIDRLTDLKVVQNAGKASGLQVRGPAMISHSQRLTNAVVSRLGALQQRILVYLNKQLELPISDLPPKVVKQLTMPKLLKVMLVGNRSGAESLQNDLQAYVTIGIDDTAVSQEAIDATLEVVRFIDNNFSKVQAAVGDTFQSVRQNIRDEAQARLDMLTDSTKALLKIASGERETDRTVRHYLSFVDDWKLGNVSDEALLQALGNLYDVLKQAGKLPEDLPLPQASSLNESFDLDNEIASYLGEDQTRSRQMGIYKFYCMIGYSITEDRGLEDMLAEARAIPSVTIVTVVVSNRRVSESRHIAGLSVKFIPSTPGSIRAPEDAKASILRDIRRLKGVEKIFKVSSSVERIE